MHNHGRRKRGNLDTLRCMTRKASPKPKAGFKLVSAVPNPSYGRKLVDEFWDLEL
jgi:hypothetical protein